MAIEPKHLTLTMIGEENGEKVRTSLIVDKMEQVQVAAYFIEEVFGGQAIISLGDEVMYMTTPGDIAHEPGN